MCRGRGRARGNNNDHDQHAAQPLNGAHNRNLRASDFHDDASA